MIVAGVMSGTSADGIDVAIARILGRTAKLRLRLLAHRHFSYPSPVRQAVLNAMNSTCARVADLSRLNFLLGGLYADAVQETARRSRLKIDLIGCHGQTLYHQGDALPFLGRSVAATWQTGEGSMLAARLRVPVVSDFRPADMAAGGKGAPLVPLLDIAYYGHRKKLRILQNIGGIGNLTVLPPGAHLGRMDGAIAFDTGPGNMVIDACAQKLLGKSFDANGAIAAKGEVIGPALKRALAHPFFRRKPPKTTGREEFGREFVAQFFRWCGPRAGAENVLATATAFTATSIGRAVRQALTISKVRIPLREGDAEYIVSGGGVNNRTLMRMIADQVQPLGFRIFKSDELGMPAEAKEAVAFALLAYQTWNREPGNVPDATGAHRPVVLGKISFALKA
jgi:anhydro-N-acetylmuramic acid kinase